MSGLFHVLGDALSVKEGQAVALLPEKNRHVGQVKN
jgi:hypothetical protein